MPDLPLAPSCSLDADGLSRQLARYRQGGTGARVIEHGSRTLVVKLAEAVDPVAVEQAVAIERACCPFFAISWDAERRRLAISVSAPGHEPALKAIASALGV